MRIGNAAFEQFQLDVYGEVLDALYALPRIRRSVDRTPGPCTGRCSNSWRSTGNEPDEGIWEVRGPRPHFTHSKVMAWVAFDRAVKFARENRLCRRSGRCWRNRDVIHKRGLSRKGYGAARGSFVQYYGGNELDAVCS